MVSRRLSAPAAAPVRMNPLASRSTTSPSHSVHGSAPRKRNQDREREAPTCCQRDGVDLAVGSVQGGDLAAVRGPLLRNGQARRPVVGPRLAHVGAAMQQCHERPAAGEPDRGLAGRVSSADNGHALAAAQLRLRRSGGVEDADVFVIGEVVDGSLGTARRSRSTARAAISRSSSSRRVWRPSPGSSDSARYARPAAR